MLFLSRTRPRPVSVSFFLNPHGPLSFTSHCPFRSAFPPFQFVFPFLYPHSPSPVYGFSRFSFLFGMFSSLRFVCFSLFLFYFSASFPSPFSFKKSPSLFLVLGTVFIEQRGAACCCVWRAGQRRVGWWARLARRGAPDFSLSWCMGLRAFAGHSARRI